MGHFTEEQIRELSAAFVICDEDGKGFIKSTHLKHLLNTVGYNPTDKVHKLTIFDCGLL